MNFFLYYLLIDLLLFPPAEFLIISEKNLSEIGRKEWLKWGQNVGITEPSREGGMMAGDNQRW